MLISVGVQVGAIDLKPLIGRLNNICRQALERAAGLTLSRSHYNVEIEHFLIGLADRADTDLAGIFRQWEVELGAAAGGPQSFA